MKCCSYGRRCTFSCSMLLGGLFSFAIIFFSSGELFLLMKIKVVQFALVSSDRFEIRGFRFENFWYSFTAALTCWLWCTLLLLLFVLLLLPLLSLVGDSKGIQPNKTSASKPLAILVNISGDGTLWVQWVLACPLSVLRIKMTVDWRQLTRFTWKMTI